MEDETKFERINTWICQAMLAVVMIGLGAGIFSGSVFVVVNIWRELWK